MFINIDYNKRPKEAKLHLAKPNKRVVSHIYEKFNDSLAIKLGNINELSFSIPHFVTDEETNQRVINEHVNLIKEKMLVRITLGTYKEWYLVDEIDEDVDDTDTFNVKAFSLGYELKGKRVSGYTTESSNATEVATLLLKDTVWRIGEIDPMFDGMFRSFDSGEDSNVLDCLTQWAETFGGLLVWDTIGRKVSLKDMSKDGRFRGMTVNYGRFLRSLKRTRTTDEMITRLWVEGSEGLTIHSVNPTGQAYIEDFSFFMYPFERDANKNTIKSSHFMSDELCHAILDHKALVVANEYEIKTISEELSAKRVAIISEKSILDNLKLELTSILELLDIAQATEDETLIQQRKSERDAKNAEINAQQAVVDNLQTQINSLETQLSGMQDDISNQANFTTELLEELNLYTYESTWRDDRYIDEKELYDDAVKKFMELREPKVVIEVSIDNLMNIVEEQYYWDKLVLGDLIKVKYPQMNIEYMAKIIEINYDLENSEASIVIANTKDLLSDTEKLVQLLYSNSSASTLVQNNKYKWDKVNALQKEVSQIVTNEWDANKNKIIAGVKNSVEVGNRGIIITNPDFPNEVVIMQAGIIALSKDAGETWKTAIKPDGIVAERLIGQIIAGQELIITNSGGSFTLDNNGAVFDVGSFIIRSSSGEGNLVDRWQDNADFVDAYKDDNLITAYEKKMLKIEWEEIDKRYQANSEKIINFYEDDGVSLEWVQSYHARYNELYDYLFVTVHGDLPMLDPTNMAYTTRIIADEFNAVFRNYDTNLVEAEKQLDLRANQIAELAKASADSAQQRIDEVENDIVYKTELHSSNGILFNNGDIDTTVTARVYRGKEDITDTLPITAFIWKKADRNGVADTVWNNSHMGIGKQITISKSDVDRKATFWCEIDIPE